MSDFNDLAQQDPAGYLIRYADDGERLEVLCLVDGSRVGVYDTRADAIAAASADPAVPTVAPPA